jgi:hypothetical protein
MGHKVYFYIYINELSVLYGIRQLILGFSRHRHCSNLFLKQENTHSYDNTVGTNITTLQLLSFPSPTLCQSQPSTTNQISRSLFLLIGCLLACLPYCPFESVGRRVSFARRGEGEYTLCLRVLVQYGLEPGYHTGWA